MSYSALYPQLALYLTIYYWLLRRIYGIAEELKRCLLSQFMSLEKYISTKNKRLTDFNKKWTLHSGHQIA